MKTLLNRLHAAKIVSVIVLAIATMTFSLTYVQSVNASPALAAHLPTSVVAAQPKFVKSDCDGPAIRAGAPEGDPNHCGILDLLQIVTNTLSAVVGITIVIMIIVAGIQYSSAEDNPQKVQAARTRIVNAIIALIVFIFMFAILQYLIPGGIF